MSKDPFQPQQSPTFQRFRPEIFADLACRAGCDWGRALQYRASTGSTNDDALGAAKQGAPSGTVFLADGQAHGRGRHGRTWQMPEGAGLLFSVLLRPQSLSELGVAVTLAAGLAVRRALAPHSRTPLVVKWPNDVLAQRKKLAGILCEAQLEGARVAALVIGVGINVHAGPGGELEPLTTYLKALGAEPSREELLVQVLSALQASISQLQGHGLTPLLEEFRQHDALQGLNVEVTGDACLRGVAAGINEAGHLLIHTQHGIRAISSGTVRHAE